MLDRTRDQGHGRVEIRTLRVVTVRGFGFPRTSQVLQVTRKVRDLGGRRWRTTVVYAVTSLAHAQASPARLADLLRGHWSIESGLHWARDVTMGEDASQVRTGAAPQVMACLRNLANGVLRSLVIPPRGGADSLAWGSRAARGSGTVGSCVRSCALDGVRPKAVCVHDPCGGGCRGRCCAGWRWGGRCCVWPADC